ncbi:MAG: indole-3-glycerol phosphate synthase TrpC [Hyphomicrobiales bacterium]
MASDILDRIVQAKQVEVQAARQEIPLNRLREIAEARNNIRPFFDALKAPGPSGVNIIAEVKRASPSKGTISNSLDPGRLAASYAAGGAAAVSVLTERSFFLGSPEDLQKARMACALPVLRKDFIFCDYQIYESAAIGADAVLLIVRILSESELTGLIDLATRLGLAALVEVYSEAELKAAEHAGARLIGINNRDLSSFETDLDRTLRLVPLMRPGQVAVAASGISSREDIRSYQAQGVFNFLIGEHLVRSEDPAGLLKMLQGSKE